MADPVPVHIKDLGTRPVNGTERVPNQRSTEGIAYRNTIDEIHSYRWHVNARPPTSTDNLASGYGLYHHWVDTSADPPEVHVKVAEVSDVAVWSNLSTGGTGGGSGGTATALLETDGPTALAIGAILDGQVVRRAGETLIGVSGLGTVVEAVASSRDITASDHNKVLLATGTITLTLLPAPASQIALTVVNVGTGIVTIAGQADVTLLPGGANRINKVDIYTLGAGSWFTVPAVQDEEVMMFALSDETSPLTAIPNRLSFRMAYPFVPTRVRASLSQVVEGGVVSVDMNVEGSTILSSKIVIGDEEATSTTFTTQPVITTSLIADDAQVVFDIDEVGTIETGRGLKVYLYGYRA